MSKLLNKSCIEPLFRTYPIKGKRRYCRHLFAEEIPLNIYIESRVLDIASYIIETGATVRAAAGVFGVSKSTVHKDITERLRQINKVLAEQVAAVLEINREERHIRGGRATYLKYHGQDQLKEA